jgi:hypothetical protein
VEADKKDREAKQFVEMVGSIKKLGMSVEKVFDATVKAEENWFTGSLLKLFK